MTKHRGALHPDTKTQRQVVGLACWDFTIGQSMGLSI